MNYYGNMKIVIDEVGNSYWNCCLSFKLFKYKYRKQNWFKDDQNAKTGDYWLFGSLEIINVKLALLEKFLTNARMALM
jgi:hypothetical protein